MTSELAVARGILLGMTLASYPVVFGLAALIGLNIDPKSFMVVGCYFGAMLAFFGGYCHLRRIHMLGYVFETTFCMILVSNAVLISTYIAMRLDMPLADQALVRWDATLGIDWHSLISFVDSRPLLAEALGFSYQTFLIQLLAVPFLLVVSRKALRAYHMVIAYALIGFISSVLAIWFPALGTYAVYGLAQAELVNINAHFGYFFLDQFNAVRTDPNFVLALENSAGILTFPSVHAAVAVLCAWASWAVRLIRIPMLLLNILMGASAVTHANHYVVDVIAGIVVAAASIALVTWLTRRRWSKREAVNPVLVPA